MSNQTTTGLLSYCRGCGGDRHHTALAEKNILWEEKGTTVSGGDEWQMLQCMGCDTITFVHSSWFSEETEYTDDGPQPVVRRQLYPSALQRKRPEWGPDLLLGLPIEQLWKSKILDDIYSAIASSAYALAAMGMRALVDSTISATAGEYNSFRDKLTALTPSYLTELEANVIFAAFDMGSAAAHRGYTPSESDAFMLLDVTEMVIGKFFVAPVRHARLSNVAEMLTASTPPRPHVNKSSTR